MMAGSGVGAVTRASWRFMGVLVIVLMLITFVPAMVLWLPDLVFDR
jgi:TRAP-type C4-dicarboxylate transport system permease large subunit